MIKRKVGRPIEKENRKKIGLSIDGQTDSILNELVQMTGKTKSKIVEESLDLMYKKHIENYERLKLLDKESSKIAYSNFKEFLQNSMK